MQQLRGWQEMSLSNWGYADKWMLEATPGAGKTTFALEAARRAQLRGVWGRLLSNAAAAADACGRAVPSAGWGDGRGR